MAEINPRGIQATLFDYFQDTEYFDLQEANELLLEHQQRDINAESIRARIYEGIDKGLFERVGKGLYTVTRKDNQGRENTCLLINGDGRDLSMFADNSIDALITDHPYSLKTSLKGGNRNFADYELFQYNEQDFKEKQRVLKPGCFCVEFLPEENGENYQYLYQVKEFARKAGLEYYAKVPWHKKNFVANTGRKSKDTEDVVFFSKGRARDLRPDAKKDKQYASGRAIVEYQEFIPGGTTVHYTDMGSMGMSSETTHVPVDVNIRISVAKEHAAQAKELLEDAFDSKMYLFMEDSPLDCDHGGQYTLEQLDNMTVQDYMLRYLEAKELSFIDLSPGPKDIFQSKSQVIVNPTNLIGPMGAGLAKSFKEKYPQLEQAYKNCCIQGNMCSCRGKLQSQNSTGGKILTSECSALLEGDLFLFCSPAEEGQSSVLCFPTKRDWKDPSALDLIEAGLRTFAENYKHFNIKSITFPKLGCGLGGLDWEKDVRPLMQKYLGDLQNVEVQICGDTLREDTKEHFMSGAAGMLPTVFDVAPPSKKDKIHQAEKPVELLEQIIRFVTKEDELILDQFAGSGVLGEAALRSHRNSILIEKDAETFNKLRNRIEVLGNIEVHSEDEREAINLGIDALESMHDGWEQMENFLAYHKNRDTALNNAVQVLQEVSMKAGIPEQDALQAAASAIATATKIIPLPLGQNSPAPLVQSDQTKSVETTNAQLAQNKVLECSSRGDKRFSALFAKVTIKGKERSIEEFYQDAKRTADGKKAGKGRPFDHIIDPYTGTKLPAAEASNLYKGLWISYFSKNPDLAAYAGNFEGFTDMFRNEKTENCQADVIAAYVKDKEGFTNEVRKSPWYQNIVQRKQTSLSDRIQTAERKSRVQVTEQISLFAGTQDRSAR